MSKILAVSYKQKLLHYMALQYFRNISAFTKYQFFPPIFPLDSFVNPGCPNCKQSLSLCDFTNSASCPASKCYCFPQTTVTEHEEKERWQRSHHCWPLSPSDRSTLYLNKMCSMTLAALLWGKHSPPPPAPPRPHDNLLNLCIAISSLRLQAAARRERIGSWARNSSLLDADCSSTAREGQKNLLKSKNQSHNPG